MARRRLVRVRRGLLRRSRRVGPVQRGRGCAHLPASLAGHAGPRARSGSERGQRVRVRASGRAADGPVRSD